MMKNNYKKISFFYLAALALFLFWLVPPFSHYWQTIDRGFFLLLNKSLSLNKIWLNFWAVMNWKGERLLSLIPMGLVYVYYIKNFPKQERFGKFLNIAAYFIIVVTLLMAIRLVMHNGLHLRRNSPTLALEGSVRLSTYFPTFSIKDSSRISFPGDHTTFLLLWGSYLWAFASKKYKWIAAIFTIGLSMPRLIAGAHWLSDDIVGGGGLSLIISAWGLYSPVTDKLTKFLKDKVQWIKNKKLLKNF